MITNLVGRLFQAVGRVRGGTKGSDLAHVGSELRRLQTAEPHPTADPHPVATSR